MDRIKIITVCKVFHFEQHCEREAPACEDSHTKLIMLYQLH